jgi:hypothetical protein
MGSMKWTMREGDESYTFVVEYGPVGGMDPVEQRMM